MFDILATPSSYEIVSLDFGDGYVIPPPWLDYTGKWGPTINTLWKEEAKIAINLLPCPPYYNIPPPWLDYTGKWGPTINTLWKEEPKIAINLLPCPPNYKITANAIVSKLPQALFGQDGLEGPKKKPSWNGDESE
nr:hypothetical protein [Tanacetum cinerariifolium]